jgi:hypothetical protein
LTACVKTVAPLGFAAADEKKNKYFIQSTPPRFCANKESIS